MTRRPLSKAKPRRPSPPGQHKKPKAKAAPRYAECKAEWESRKHDPDRGGGDWLVDKPDLPMDAKPFLATLRRLGYATQDRRFFDLHRHLTLNGSLIDAKGKWSRYGTVLAHPDTRMLCEEMAEYIAAGVPEREVLAEAVMALNIKAVSFAAAVQRLRALLDAHRKSVSEKTARIS